jgi:hypothetical protein
MGTSKSAIQLNHPEENNPRFILLYSTVVLPYPLVQYQLFTEKENGKLKI